jgi:hypothetical protein
VSDASGPAPRKSRRRRPPKKSKSADIWRAPAQPMPDPAPIVPIGDPTTMLRSLGDPPLPGQGAVAEHHLKAVVERAAQVAMALAATADLLVEPDDDPVDL